MDTLFYLLLHFILFHFACGDQNERILYDKLLENYNNLERPVENNTEAVVVHLGIFLQQIIDVDEKNQIIQTNVWLNYSWYDYNLKWDPENYGGVTDLRFPASKLWKPDVLLFNSVDSNFDSTYPSNLIVSFDGMVIWVPPGILRSSCNMDIKWFPFDDQECCLKFGSWTYTKDKLVLYEHHPEMDKSSYIESGEWILKGQPVKYVEYEFSGSTYNNLFFFLNLRRRTLYYGFNLIIPSVMISMMTLLGFALPVESGEKVTLEITILLSICVFLNMVGNMTPTTSEAVPLIGTFFSCNMLLVSASVVLSVVVLNLHYRTPDTHAMSFWVKKVLLNWLPWLLGMKRPGRKLTRKRLMEMCKSKSPDSEKLMPSDQEQDGADKLHLVGQYQQLLDSFVDSTAKPLVENANASVHLLRLQQIYWELKFITQRMKRDDEEQDVKNDWKFAAMVVDKLCFYMFTVFIIGSTCGILFSAPHLIA